MMVAWQNSCREQRRRTRNILRTKRRTMRGGRELIPTEESAALDIEEEEGDCGVETALREVEDASASTKLSGTTKERGKTSKVSCSNGSMERHVMGKKKKKATTCPRKNNAASR